MSPLFAAGETGTTLTFAIAVGAGLISFLSPCVLPLVPAYLGQLTAVAVAGRETAGPPSRWLALAHSAAYVVGFGLVFTLLGITATFAGGPLFGSLDVLRQIGGVVLVVMGLSLTGLVRVPVLDRVWRPLEAGAAAAVATQSGTIALGRPTGPAGSTGPDAGPTASDRLANRLVGQRGGLAASFGLGAIFAIGWTPCIGIILGGILTLAATSGSTPQGALLLVGYTLGLGIPFLAVGLLYDRAPALLRPLVRHGRAVSIVGGTLVIAIGVAMITGWLGLLPRYFTFNTAI